MASKLALYDYCASGIEWLGELPAHWKIWKIGHLLRLKSGEAISAEQIDANGPYPVYGGNGIRGFFTEFNHVGNYILIGRQGALCGNIQYGHGKFWATEHALVVYPQKELHYKWLGETLRHMNLNQYSISAAQPGLSVSNITSLRIPVPPLDEQTQIAKFLDYETAKIDALIAKQQQLIALLQEKRQAVISHAVTKGLNPAAPLRDSGVEWLGQVPAHWEVKKLGHLGELQNGLNIGGDAFGSGDPFVSYGDVYNNAIVPSLPTGLVQSTADDQIKYSLKSGDVLFTRTSETVDDIGVASTCLQEIPKVTFAGFLIRFRPLPGKLNPNYSSFLFRNRSIQDFFAGSMNLVTRASLSQNVLKTLPV